MPDPDPPTPDPARQSLPEAAPLPDIPDIEDALRRIREIGTPIKIRPYRQIWRFPYQGRTLYLKWFPRAGNATKKLLRGGDPANREYARLIQLQKAKIPAPRALAYLSGMLLETDNGIEKGDGILTLAIEPSEPLDAILHRARHSATLVPHRRHLLRQMIAILRSLARAGLGHSDLHFGNFLVHRGGEGGGEGGGGGSGEKRGGLLFLLDPSALHAGGLTQYDLSVLAHAAGAFGGWSAGGLTTRTERLRLWRALTPPGTPPPRAPMEESKRFWKKRLTLATPARETDHIGHIAHGSYSGLFFKHHRFPHRHSRASALTITAEDWSRELPRLLDQLEGGLLQPLKRSASADVFAGQITLAGVPLEVVVKRPKRKHAYRYLTEIGRGSRAYRAWRKTWMLLLRNLPAAWPLLLLERRVAGVVLDQYFIAEKVPGPQLDAIDLEALTPHARDALFRRTGHLLRHIDDTGLVHFDTKASNFIAMPDPALGPTPVCIDPDGIRPYTCRLKGLKRLLRSLKSHHPQFAEIDAASLKSGYDPTGKKTAGL